MFLILLTSHGDLFQLFLVRAQSGRSEPCRADWTIREDVSIKVQVSAGAGGQVTYSFDRRTLTMHSAEAIWRNSVSLVMPSVIAETLV
jgi:hypothetical protein